MFNSIGEYFLYLMHVTLRSKQVQRYKPYFIKFCIPAALLLWACHVRETLTSRRDTFRLTWTHMYSLDLSLSLHEDKLPLPGESPLQPGEILLQEPIRSSIRGEGYLNDDIIHSLWWRAITLDYGCWDETTSHQHEQLTELLFPHSIQSSIHIHCYWNN